MSEDRGAVTVEAAIALASLVAVAVLVVGGVLATVSQVRCVDAAREAARLVARGEPERGRAVAVALAPSGAEIELRQVGDEVSVVVRAPASALVPGWELSADAYAVAEPEGVGINR
ncbi:TadE family type IV pilus minor pilin [Actinokineospora pegani]|uniref:TadE family type IV pilus minor pilin n=1 Tax=Actinokineospora pegani TaxID=2654637 RepID=UPI0012E9E9B3|nr:TadE family type IV pilus minor pilin [Actinokineospora pegani]